MRRGDMLQRCALTLMCASAAAAVAGCIVTEDFSGNYSCPDDSCPDGQVCFQGRCVLQVPGADAEISDAAVSADAGLPATPKCFDPAAMRSNFDTKPFHLQRNGLSTGTDTYNGSLTLTVPAATGGDDLFMFIDSDPHVSFVGTRVFVEVASVVHNDDLASTVFLTEGGPRAEVRVRDGMIVGSHFDGSGGLQISGLATYNPVDHRYWGILEQDSVVSTQVSPDGITWTTLSTRAEAVTWADNVHLNLRLEVPNGGAGASAVFGGFHTGDEPDLPPVDGCSPSELAESFDDSVLPDLWHVFERDCARLISNGRIDWQLDPLVEGICFIDSETLVDMRGGAYSAEVIAMPPTTTPGGLRMKVEAQEQYYEFYQNVGALEMYYCDPGCTELGSVTYDSEAHRWWQIREQDGNVFWEFSPDGISWTTAASVLGQTGLERTDFRMEVYGNLMGTFGQYTLDNINVRP